MVTLVNTIEDKFARTICREHGNRPEELLEIMHAVQHRAGFVSDEALRTIANALNISRADIQGVISFYHDYKRAPQAKVTLKLCRAEACQAVGANDLIREAEAAFGTKLDAPASEVALESAYCLGNCALGPAVLVNDDLYGRVNVKRLQQISMKHREGTAAS